MSEHPNLWVVFVSDEPIKLCPRTFKTREAAEMSIERWTAEGGDGVTYELVEYAPANPAHPAVEVLDAIERWLVEARGEGPVRNYGSRQSAFHDALVELRSLRNAAKGV